MKKHLEKTNRAFSVNCGKMELRSRKVTFLRGINRSAFHFDFLLFNFMRSLKSEMPDVKGKPTAYKRWVNKAPFFSLLNQSHKQQHTWNKKKLQSINRKRHAFFFLFSIFFALCVHVSLYWICYKQALNAKDRHEVFLFLLFQFFISSKRLSYSPTYQHNYLSTYLPTYTHAHTYIHTRDSTRQITHQPNT